MKFFFFWMLSLRRDGVAEVPRIWSSWEIRSDYAGVLRPLGGICQAVNGTLPNVFCCFELRMLLFSLKTLAVFGDFAPCLTFKFLGLVADDCLCSSGRMVWFTKVCERMLRWPTFGNSCFVKMSKFIGSTIMLSLVWSSSTMKGVSSLKSSSLAL
jgi:hypothetical protein